MIFNLRFNLEVLIAAFQYVKRSAYTMATVLFLTYVHAREDGKEKSAQYQSVHKNVKMVRFLNSVIIVYSKYRLFNLCLCFISYFRWSVYSAWHMWVQTMGKHMERWKNSRWNSFISNSFRRPSNDWLDVSRTSLHFIILNFN